MSYGASNITVALKGAEEPNVSCLEMVFEATEPLSVESCQSSEVPGSLCVAEMMAPESGGFRGRSGYRSGECQWIFDDLCILKSLLTPFAAWNEAAGCSL